MPEANHEANPASIILIITAITKNVRRLGKVLDQVNYTKILKSYWQTLHLKSP